VGDLSPKDIKTAQTLADVAAADLINAQARSDLQDSSDQSREAALHDRLTGLPNRVLMLERLEHAFQRNRRSGNTSAVFFIDLDRFKEVNDSHGHQVGDELLVAVAERMTGVLRPGDSLARLSGDEFAVLCEDLDDHSQAEAIALRFDAELSRPFALSGLEVKISASIGIASAGEGGEAPDDLLHDADLAMYRTKRDRVAPHDLHDLRTLRLAGHHAGLARGLPGAVERGELHLEYQPIVDARHRRITGMEALLRWAHPTRGAVAPMVFIPFAEQSRQIVELGQWVLQRAWSDRQQHQRQQTGEIGMSVNVSAHQFMAAGFAAAVAGILDSQSTDPGLLTLEVTESVFVRDEGRALVVLRELKDMGAKLALDDFGTGYSSLGYLDTLPIDTLKVDRTFIAKLTGDPDSQTVIAAIIQLAHRLGLTVVSEGVETAEQHRQLTELGSDSCQGFYFARPMAGVVFDQLTRDQAHASDAHLPVLTTASV
jgi:diguanylate cyclase (GGDEF)-like protein